MSDDNKQDAAEPSPASAGSVATNRRLVQRLRVLADDSRKVYGLHSADCAAAMGEAADEIARLRLTDAEQDAVEVAARFMDKWGGVPNTIVSDALRGLLDRLK